jgi:hypothetical protein
VDSHNYDTRSGRPDRPRPNGWQRVAGLVVVGTVATVLTIFTGSADAAIGVVVPLLPFLPR